MNEKHDFTLEIVSQIDDETIEKNLNKRAIYWTNRKRRRNPIIPIVSAVACLCIVFGTAMAFMLGKDDRQIPVYNGMTVSSVQPMQQELRALPSENNYIPGLMPVRYNVDYGISLLGAKETNAPKKDKSETSDTKAVDKVNDLSPEVFGGTYYALNNEDIYIYVHLSNPDAFEIVSFTLNGKKYSSNMFEPGSDLETLILKYNVGDVDGMQEYTIDAIKYIDGEKIKDVRMDGDRTVKVYVNDESQPLNLGAKIVGFDLVLSPTWAEDFTGEKKIISLSVWEEEEKVRDLDANATKFNSLPRGKRLVLKATYLDGDKEAELMYVFDTPKQSEGLAITNGKIVGVGTCTDSVLYIETPIADKAFFENTLITKVYMGNGVTSIGESAFSGCISLSEVIFSKNTKSIGDSAFSGCTALKEVDIFGYVENIGACAFQNCTALTKIILPESLKSIGRSAFLGCTSLTEIIIPQSVEYIAQAAFKDCNNLTKVYIYNPQIRFEVNHSMVLYIEYGIHTMGTGVDIFVGSGISEVYFNGTKQQWAEASLNQGRTYGATFIVHCSDRDIYLQKYTKYN